jgi:hypothetical protein
MIEKKKSIYILKLLHPRYRYYKRNSHPSEKKRLQQRFATDSPQSILHSLLLLASWKLCEDISIGATIKPVNISNMRIAAVQIISTSG